MGRGKEVVARTCITCKDYPLIGKADRSPPPPLKTLNYEKNGLKYMDSILKDK